MTTEQLQSIRAWFSAYAAPFLDAANSLAPLHTMKREHTLRVAENSTDIARALEWGEGDIYLAEAIALLHDAGRFTQLEEFKTFADRLSVNHAERARDVISDAGLLDDFSAPDKDCILTAILSHNCAHLCDDSPESARRHAELIRDADKLDIYEVAQDAIRSGHIEQHPEIAISVRLVMDVSDAILDEVRSRQLGTYRNMKTLGDFLMVQLSWVYDFNYDASLRMMRDRNVVGRIAELLPPTPGVVEVIAQVQNDLTDRLSGGLDRPNLPHP